MTKLTLRFKGGPGSGHHGHKGVPGQYGGSAPKNGAGAGETEANAMARLVTESILHNQGRPASEGFSGNSMSATIKGSKVEITQTRMDYIQDKWKYTATVDGQDVRKTFPNTAAGLAGMKKYLTDNIEKLQAANAKPVSIREVEDYVTVDGARRGIPAELLKIDATLDRFSRDPDVFTLGKSYFYRRGDETDLVNDIENSLKNTGFKVETLAAGDHYYQGFVGGAKTFSAKDSFLWAVMRITRK